MTTIKELAKSKNIPISELATKAGELGFKGGTNAELPENIEKALANVQPAKPNAENSNGNGNHSLSSNRKTTSLSNLNLEEELKVATAIGIANAELVLEATRQAYEQRLAEGKEEMREEIGNSLISQYREYLTVYQEYKAALASSESARPASKRKSITEKFAELQAEIAKK